MDFKSYSVNLVDWYGVPELADERAINKLFKINLSIEVWI